MPKFLPPSTPQLNRLRAAATLIPIIESGLADSKLSPDKAALMASFCEWAAEATTSDAEEAMLSESIGQGLDRLKARFARSV
jgi:hypothetical protein